MKRELISYKDIYPIRKLNAALKNMGDYVYGYYRPGQFQPFYVGKGRRLRVLSHWKAAIDAPKKDQEREIRRLLEAGDVPIVKLLAYNLEKTHPSDVYSVAERVLEEAFGIQKVWEKRSGAKRIKYTTEVSLLQIRDDNSNTPALSLDAVVARLGGGKEIGLQELCNSLKTPILLVGISNTYHASYSENQMADMARMYWNLDRFKNTTFPSLQKTESAILLAWIPIAGEDSGPTIVGAWRIKSNSYERKMKSGRYSFEVCVDYDLKRHCLGIRLQGTGSHYQGPRITLPEL